MTWTSERVKDLREHWKAGLSMADIASELGGFERTPDKGRSAICGMVKRLRDKAARSGNEDEVRFWTRGMGKGPRKKKGAGKSSAAAARRPRVKVTHENVAPARLTCDNEPIWKGGAFAGLLRSRDNPDGLSLSELEALSKSYT